MVEGNPWVWHLMGIPYVGNTNMGYIGNENKVAAMGIKYIS